MLNPNTTLLMGVENDPNRTVAQTADHLFPRKRDEIRRLRTSNQVFDEICRDYEIVARILRDSPLTDVAAGESLEGLKDEIRLFLHRSVASD